MRWRTTTSYILYGACDVGIPRTDPNVSPGAVSGLGHGGGALVLGHALLGLGDVLTLAFCGFTLREETEHEACMYVWIDGQCGNPNGEQMKGRIKSGKKNTRNEREQQRLRIKLVRFVLTVCRSTYHGPTLVPSASLRLNTGTAFAATTNPMIYIETFPRTETTHLDESSLSSAESLHAAREQEHAISVRGKVAENDIRHCPVLRRARLGRVYRVSPGTMTGSDPLGSIRCPKIENSIQYIPEDKKNNFLCVMVFECSASEILEIYETCELLSKSGLAETCGSREGYLPRCTPREKRLKELSRRYEH